MLTKLLIQDETTASLGKTKHTFTVHISGKNLSQRVTQEVEEINNRKPAMFHMLIQPDDSVTQLKRQSKPLMKIINKSMILSMDRKKRL